MPVQFGPFAFDIETRELRGSSGRVHLTPKAFELLALLIEERPKAVSKQRIQESLWPDTFVSESNLSVLVAEVRQALGESAREPKHIRTVHGFGYAFSGEAVLLDGAQPAGGPDPGPYPAGWLVGGRRRLALSPGENVIGREPGVAVRLESASVSRRHARIVIDANRVTIEDLASKNGTWVNEQRLERPAALDDGDQIRVGSVRLAFRREVDAGSTVTLSG